MVKAEKRTLLLNAHRGQNACEWQEMRLNDVCTKIGSGATPRGGKAVYLDDGPYALIRSQNVYNSGFQHDGLAYISEEHAAGLQNVEVLEGDVLLNITGHSVARICQVDPRILPARVNQHVAIIRTDSTRLDSGLLRYFLASPNTQALLLSLAGSGGTRNALTKEMIESLSVPAPPLPEQRAIAHILGTLDDKIELNRRMNQTLEEMARAIFKDWFIDFGPTRAKVEGRDPYLPAEVWELFPSEMAEDNSVEVPLGWRRFILSEIANLKRESVAPAKTPDELFEHYSIPSFDNREQPSLDVGSSIKSNKVRVDRMNVLLSKLNPEITRVWIPNPTTDLVQVASTEFLPFVPKVGVGQSLLYCLFKSSGFRNVLQGMVTGTSKSHQRVPLQALLNTDVIVGDLSSFENFESIVSPIVSRTLTNRLANYSLATIRDTLLPKLVSGSLSIDTD